MHCMEFLLQWRPDRTDFKHLLFRSARNNFLLWHPSPMMPTNYLLIYHRVAKLSIIIYNIKTISRIKKSPRLRALLSVFYFLLYRRMWRSFLNVAADTIMPTITAATIEAPVADAVTIVNLPVSGVPAGVGAAELPRPTTP